MAAYHGKFAWYELMTTDIKGAETFYASVMGWTAKEVGSLNMVYKVFHVDGDERGVGGVMTLPQSARDMGAPPNWIGYVAVDDVDVYAGKVAETGGAILMPASDIPGVGRFSVVADPQGANFILFKPLEGMEAPPIAPNAIGHVGWRELYAGDLEQAFAFYAGLFGWTKGEAFEMGPMGTYQLFATGAEPVGGMMTKPASMPRAAWGYYFNVAGIREAAERVKAAGGKVINGPHEVPGGTWVVQCLDPQGAMFALASATA